MSAIVIKTDGTFKRVKNLGWLLKHRQDGIKSVSIIPNTHGGCGLDVELESGQVFCTDFADKSVCIDWTRRFIYPWTTDETQVCRWVLEAWRA